MRKRHASQYANFGSLPEVLEAIYASIIELKKENKEMAEKLANLSR